MNDLPRIEPDKFEPIGAAASRVVSNLAAERVWDGKPISEPGCFRGISLADYHGKRDLFDGPSVSKSVLAWLLPTHGGSPKAFWGRWTWNPNHVKLKSTDALDFGRACHALMLADEVFSESFAVRPANFRDYKTKAAQEWRAEVEASGKTPVTPDQIERIKRMADDAARYDVVRAGVLNGAVERTLACKDPETGIWLKTRPDAMARVDGVFADLKTTSSLDEDFLERQFGDACYFLQAAMTRMICRELGIPFETFVLIYVLNDDVPDTAHVEADQFDLDRGERVIRWCLRGIRRGLDTGEWPGARPFNAGERRIQMKVWLKDRLDRFLDIEERLQEAA
ncbi:MAG TPA: PD-(D/E)XK nuclease-like domain-containing protein [Mesorhizobium sp.]|jgi:hypothetical protein|nr:PD-(D/E)XK nuclease-like domain-containing protein [Mesorhizobium sp.]